MVMTELIDRVQYPEQNDGLYFDALSYSDVKAGLDFQLQNADGQTRVDIQDTLNELERRRNELG